MSLRDSKGPQLYHWLMEADIKAAVLVHGASVTGTHLQATSAHQYAGSRIYPQQFLDPQRHWYCLAVSP